MRALLMISVSILTACAPEKAPEPEARRSVATAAGAPATKPDLLDKPPDPPAPPPAAAGLPGLMPLTETQVRGELGSGASCTLSDGGPPLMVAMLGDALVNYRGKLVHLKPEAQDWNALAEGGRFAAGELAVEIDAGAVVARQEEVIERDASVSIMRGGRGFGVSHGPRWACGA